MILHLGDCLDVLAAMEPASIDAVVTDPPYGLEFMGAEWDRLGDVRQPGDSTYAQVDNPYGKAGVRYGGTPAYGSEVGAAGRAMQAWHQAWAEAVWRVLKPGGYLLAFGGTRTYHRLACAVEDAGFEVRDSIQWIYGSGFPKNLNVGVAVDRLLGHEREVVGRRTDGRYGHGFTEAAKKALGAVVAEENESGFAGEVGQITRPATPQGAQWDGWGTALKPAHEPIVVARKPFRGTVAANVLEHGVGAINVDANRIQAPDPFGGGAKATSGFVDGYEGDGWVPGSPLGRWPANVVLSHGPGCRQVGWREVRSNANWPAERGPSDIYGAGNAGGMEGQAGLEARTPGVELVEEWECGDGCPVRELDAQSGQLRSGDPAVKRTPDAEGNRVTYGDDNRPPGTAMVGYGDEGGASRFFPVFRYQAKPSRAERNAGVTGEARPVNWSSGEQSPGTFQSPGTTRAVRNFHPTVKSVDLMRWLARLVCPAGGTVLDPFMGSGTTGVACVLEGFEFVGIERDPDFHSIAAQRVAHAAEEDGVLPIDWTRVRRLPTPPPPPPSLFD